MTPHPAGHQPPSIPYAAPPLPPRQLNWLGTTALAVALAGLLLCWSVAGGVLCGVLAVVLGLVGRRRAGTGHATNGAVATAGTALGVVAVVVSLAIIPIWVRLFHEVDLPAYADCVAGTSDRAAVQKCVDDLGQRVNTELGIENAPPA